MTTRSQAKESIYKRFADNWLDDQSAERTEFALGDEQFDPPDGPHVRVTIRHLDRSQETLNKVGARKFETVGLLTMQYRQPPKASEETMEGHVEKAIEIFEGIRIGGTTIRFGSVIGRELGLIDKDRWNATNVQGNFIYTETK